MYIFININIGEGKANEFLCVITGYVFFYGRKSLAVGQGSEDFFYEGLDSNILYFVSCVVSVTAAQLYLMFLMLL